MKIYTRTGDAGSTGLFGGPRVRKDDHRIEAYGTVDELNAAIGFARTGQLDQAVDAQLEQVQHELFSIGAELASPEPDRHGLRIIQATHIERLERWIDQHEQTLPALKHFILPAGAGGASPLHLARAVCRRSERRVVTLAEHADAAVRGELVIYLNRLSDLLFVLARVASHRSGAPEVEWVRPN